MDKKRKFGVGGSGITEDRWDYMQRIAVGPVRLPPEEIDAETFRELLERQGLPSLEPKKDIPMPTTEEFMRLLNSPGAQTTRQTRSQLKRIADAQEYFQRQEYHWWCNQQIQILRTLDEKAHQDKVTAYNSWVKNSFMPRLKKAYKRIEDPKKAREFVNYAHKLIQDGKPKRRARGSMVIIERIRRMVIERNYNDLEAFNKELAPLLKSEEE